MRMSDVSCPNARLAIARIEVASSRAPGATFVAAPAITCSRFSAALAA
jgi:hypothetical protein